MSWDGYARSYKAKINNSSNPATLECSTAGNVPFTYKGTDPSKTVNVVIRIDSTDRAVDNPSRVQGTMAYVLKISPDEFTRPLSII